MSTRDQRSPEAAAWRKLYNTARWRRIRADQLSLQPLCAMCLKVHRLTPATICDHVDPKAKATEQGFFGSPLQSLCKPHHDSGKQADEARGYSGECDEDGWPSDPRHPSNVTS